MFFVEVEREAGFEPVTLSLDGFVSQGVSMELLRKLFVFILCRPLICSPFLSKPLPR